MKNSKIVIKILLFSLLFVIFIQPTIYKASENEVIKSFHSDIVINKDATMQVTETITVTSAEENIKHGIYREFPTKYTDNKGSNINIGFKVVSVKRDGEAEEYNVSQESNGKRITIGNKDVTLPSGDHTYTIVYNTYRQLGYFQDNDELFWNVTGNGWSFYIEEASATITLPVALDMSSSKLGGYTGIQGSKDKNLEYSIDKDGKAVFKTTQALSYNEGLSVYVTFPKGIIQNPNFTDKFSYWVQDNLFALIILFGTLTTLALYLFGWIKYGRDPKKGIIIPLYTPPRDLGPEDLRYIFNMGYDNKTLTSAIINMAVQGYLEIKEGKGKKTYTLTKTGNNYMALTDTEKVIAKELPESTELKQEYNPVMTAIISKLKSKLSELYYKVYFNSNSEFIIIGIFISIVTVIIAFVFSKDSISAIAVIPGIILAAEHLVSWQLLKAPTVEGRKLMDEIEGFKLFLTVTEKERLNLLNPPDKTPELFEKYLPYALALNVEQKWAEQFSKMFSQMNEDGVAYSPIWYMGAAWNINDTSNFASSFNHSFSTVISSASTAPGSSSGSSYSGGSGGGGGGGGGGGW